MHDLESRIQLTTDEFRRHGVQIPPADLARALQEAIEVCGMPEALSSDLVGVLACLRLYAEDGLPDVFSLPATLEGEG